MKVIPFINLETERLYLRQLEFNDWECVSFLRSDEKVNKFVKRAPAKTQIEASAFIEKINFQIKEGLIFYWAICSKENEKMMGSICLWNLSQENSYAELGYDLHPLHQGKGIMSEALNCVMDFAFNNLEAQIVEAYTHRDNTRSTRLLRTNEFDLVEGKVDVDNGNNVVFVKNRNAK